MPKITVGLPWVWMSAALLLAAAAPVRAQEAQGLRATRLEEAVSELADKVADYVKNTAGVNVVSVGSFTERQGGMDVSFGPAIKVMMVEKLAAKPNGVTTELRQKTSFKGEYTYFADIGKIELSVAVVQDGLTRKTFTADVFNVSNIAAIMGATGVLSLDLNQRGKDLQASITKPEPKIVPSPLEGAAGIPARAAAAKNALYAMEIWRLKRDKVGQTNPADSDYEPLPIEVDTSQFLRVELEQKDLYAVRLINNTKNLAAATLTIDGLNMFTFSDVSDYRGLGKVLVPPGPQGVLIKGWHRTDERSDSFEVCDVGESAAVGVKNGPAGQVVVDDKVGVITALFAVALDVDSNSAAPADEPRIISVGTKLGPALNQAYRPMRVKIGENREVISIRYNHPLPQ